jgi:putative Mg2+ transporter-C (MgtC) family protein
MIPSSAAFVVNLLAALGAGAAIGMERSYHGRPAGFRTHALVSLASALLMLVTVEAGRWFPGGADTVRVDPTRMAQGIMTGIGFLGAGVIFKEGITVRGLTTAASIWITSAIGILIGIGLWAPSAVATVLTLGVLSAFRWIEQKLPSYQYAYHRVRFERSNVMPEERLRDLLRERGFSISDLSYRLTEDGKYVEYRMTIRTSDAKNFPRLAESLWRLELVREFNISPANA